MSETWKGKTRGGIFGYMFFIYMIRCLGITAAVRLPGIGRPLLHTFRTESNGQYLELRTEQAEIRTAEIRRTAPEKLLPAGTNID